MTNIIMAPTKSCKSKNIAKFIKIYTDWANHYLEGSREKRLVKDLQVDVADGVLLASIVEAVTKRKVANIKQSPKNELQMIENVETCLQLIKTIGISIEGIKAQDIRDGNLKAILSLFFNLSRYTPPNEASPADLSSPPHTRPHQTATISPATDDHPIENCFRNSSTSVKGPAVIPNRTGHDPNAKKCGIIPIRGQSHINKRCAVNNTGTNVAICPTTPAPSRLKQPKLNSFAASNCSNRRPPYGANQTSTTTTILLPLAENAVPTAAIDRNSTTAQLLTNANRKLTQIASTGRSSLTSPVESTQHDIPKVPKTRCVPLENQRLAEPTKLGIPKPVPHYLNNSTLQRRSTSKPLASHLGSGSFYGSKSSAGSAHFLTLTRASKNFTCPNSRQQRIGASATITSTTCTFEPILSNDDDISNEKCNFGHKPPSAGNIKCPEDCHTVKNLVGCCSNNVAITTTPTCCSSTCSSRISSSRSSRSNTPSIKQSRSTFSGPPASPYFHNLSIDCHPSSSDYSQHYTHSTSQANYAASSKSSSRSTSPGNALTSNLQHCWPVQNRANSGSSTTTSNLAISNIPKLNASKAIYNGSSAFKKNHAHSTSNKNLCQTIHRSGIGGIGSSRPNVSSSCDITVGNNSNNNTANIRPNRDHDIHRKLSCQSLEQQRLQHKPKNLSATYLVGPVTPTDPPSSDRNSEIIKLLGDGGQTRIIPSPNTSISVPKFIASQLNPPSCLNLTLPRNVKNTTTHSTDLSDSQVQNKQSPMLGKLKLFTNSHTTPKGAIATSNPPRSSTKHDKSGSATSLLPSSTPTTSLTKSASPSSSSPHTDCNDSIAQNHQPTVNHSYNNSGSTNNKIPTPNKSTTSIPTPSNLRCQPSTSSSATTTTKVKTCTKPTDKAKPTNSFKCREEVSGGSNENYNNSTLESSHHQTNHDSNRDHLDSNNDYDGHKDELANVSLELSDSNIPPVGTEPKSIADINGGDDDTNDNKASLTTSFKQHKQRTHLSTATKKTSSSSGRKRPKSVTNNTTAATTNTTHLNKPTKRFDTKSNKISTLATCPDHKNMSFLDGNGSQRLAVSVSTTSLTSSTKSETDRVTALLDAPSQVAISVGNDDNNGKNGSTVSLSYSQGGVAIMSGSASGIPKPVAAIKGTTSSTTKKKTDTAPEGSNRLGNADDTDVEMVPTSGTYRIKPSPGRLSSNPDRKDIISGLTMFQDQQPAIIPSSYQGDPPIPNPKGTDDPTMGIDRQLVAKDFENDFKETRPAPLGDLCNSNIVSPKIEKVELIPPSTAMPCDEANQPLRLGSSSTTVQQQATPSPHHSNHSPSIAMVSPMTHGKLVNDKSDKNSKYIDDSEFAFPEKTKKGNRTLDMNSRHRSNNRLNSSNSCNTQDSILYNGHRQLQRLGSSSNADDMREYTNYLKMTPITKIISKPLPKGYNSQMGYLSDGDALKISSEERKNIIMNQGGIRPGTKTKMYYRDDQYPNIVYSSTANNNPRHMRYGIEDISCTDGRSNEPKNIDSNYHDLYEGANSVTSSKPHKVDYCRRPNKTHQSSDMAKLNSQITSDSSNPIPRISSHNLQSFSIPQDSRNSKSSDNEPTYYPPNLKDAPNKDGSSSSSSRIMNTVLPYTDANLNTNTIPLSTSSTSNSYDSNNKLSPYAYWPNTMTTQLPTPKDKKSKLTAANLNPYRIEPSPSPYRDHFYGGAVPGPNANGDHHHQQHQFSPNKPCDNPNGETMYSTPSPLLPGNKDYASNNKNYASLNYSTLSPYHHYNGNGNILDPSASPYNLNCYGLTAGSKPYPKSRNTPSVISFKSTPPANYASFGGSDTGGCNYLKRHHMFNPRNSQRYNVAATAGQYQQNSGIGGGGGLPHFLQQRNASQLIHKPPHQINSNNGKGSSDAFLGLNLDLNVPGNKSHGPESYMGNGGGYDRNIEEEQDREGDEDEIVKELEDDRIMRDLTSQLSILDKKLGIPALPQRDMTSTVPYLHNHPSATLKPRRLPFNAARQGDFSPNSSSVNPHRNNNGTDDFTILSQKLNGHNGGRIPKTSSLLEYETDLSYLNVGPNAIPANQPPHINSNINSLLFNTNTINPNDSHENEKGQNFHNINNLFTPAPPIYLTNNDRTNFKNNGSLNGRKILNPKFSPSYSLNGGGTPSRSSMDCNNTPSIYPNGTMNCDGANGSMLSLFSNVSIYSTPEEKQAHEIRKLKRELDSAQEKVFTLTNQLSTNTHVVAAFEQSLINMTQRFQNLNATATAKDDELSQLRETIEGLKKQSVTLQSVYTAALPDINALQAKDIVTLAKDSSIPSENQNNPIPSSIACSKTKKKKNWLRSSFTKAFSRTKKTKGVPSNSSVNQKATSPTLSSDQHGVPSSIGVVDTISLSSTDTRSDSTSHKPIIIHKTPNESMIAERSNNSVSPRSSYSFSSSSNDSHATPRSSVISGNGSILHNKSNQQPHPLNPHSIMVPSCILSGQQTRVIEKLDGNRDPSVLPNSRPISLEKVDIKTLAGDEFASDENVLRFLSESPPEAVIKTLVERLRDKNTKLTTFQLETLATHHRMTHMKDALKRMRKEMMDLKKDNDRLHKILTISAMHKNVSNGSGSSTIKKTINNVKTIDSHNDGENSDITKELTPIDSAETGLDKEGNLPSSPVNNLERGHGGTLPLSSGSAAIDNGDLTSEEVDVDFEKNRNCAINYIDNLLTNLATYDSHDEDNIDGKNNLSDDGLIEHDKGDADPNRYTTVKKSAMILPVPCENSSPAALTSYLKNDKGAVARVAPSSKTINLDNREISSLPKLKSQVCVQGHKNVHMATDEIPIGFLNLSHKTDWDTLESCLKRLFRQFINRLNIEPSVMDENAGGDGSRQRTMCDEEVLEIGEMRLNDISYYDIGGYYPSSTNGITQKNNSLPRQGFNHSPKRHKDGTSNGDLGLTPEESLSSYTLNLTWMTGNKKDTSNSVPTHIRYFDKICYDDMPRCQGSDDDIISQRPYDLFLNYINDAEDGIIPILKINLVLKGPSHNTIDSLVLKTLIPKPYLTKYMSYLTEHKNLVLSGPALSLKSYLAKSIAQFIIERDYKTMSNQPQSPNLCGEHDTEDMAIFDMKRRSVEELRQYLVGLNETCQRKSSRVSSTCSTDSNAILESNIDFEAVNYVPKVVIIDNLPAHKFSSLSQTFNGLSLIGRNDETSSTLPYFIITANTVPYDIKLQKACNRSSFQANGNLLNFKFIKLSVNEEPLSGMLSRYLNQKLIAEQTTAKFHESLTHVEFLTTDPKLDIHHIPSSQGEMGQIFLWINQLWLKVNTILETFSSCDATVGPSSFIGCPVSLTRSQSWFHELWNTFLVPYMSRCIKQSCQTALKGESKMILPPNCWEDPTNWVVQSYPWKNINGFSINLTENNGNHLKRLQYDDLFNPSIPTYNKLGVGVGDQHLTNGRMVNIPQTDNYFTFQTHHNQNHTYNTTSTSNPSSPIQLKTADSDPLLNMLIRLKEAANYTGSNSSNNTEDSNSDFSNRSLSNSPLGSLKLHLKNGIAKDATIVIKKSPQIKVMED